MQNRRWNKTHVLTGKLCCKHSKSQRAMSTMELPFRYLWRVLIMSDFLGTSLVYYNGETESAKDAKFLEWNFTFSHFCGILDGMNCTNFRNRFCPSICHEIEVFFMDYAWVVLQKPSDEGPCPFIRIWLAFWYCSPVVLLVLYMGYRDTLTFMLVSLPFILNKNFFLYRRFTIAFALAFSNDAAGSHNIGLSNGREADQCLQVCSWGVGFCIWGTKVYWHGLPEMGYGSLSCQAVHIMVLNNGPYITGFRGPIPFTRYTIAPLICRG